MKKFAWSAVAALGLLAVALPASAHIGIAVDGAGTPGSTNLFGFGVGHGCGVSPTTAVRIQIPAGIENVRPVAKPGWEIDIVTNAQDAVSEVHFTGGNLPNEWYDQFWLRARISVDVEAGTRIYFRVVQECAEGVYNWIGIPQGEQPATGDPAPGFTVGGGAVSADTHSDGVPH